MRITMLTPAFHPQTGGVERHVRRVAEELITRGHAVSVVARAVPGSPPRERLGEIEVVRVEGGLRACRTLWREHRDLLRGADVLHCHDAYPFLYWYTPLHPLLHLPRAFVTFHGYEAYPPPREAVRRRRWVRRACAGALCAGGFIPRWYGTLCEAVTYGGVDPVPEPPAAREERAVFVGRLESDTGIREYLRLLANLKQEHGLDLPADILGGGSLREGLERQAVAEGLRARFHGPVPDPSAFLLGARFALVSGYLAMWEALACGALVVALYDNPLKRDYLQCFPPAGDPEGPAVEVCATAASGAERLAWLAGHPEEMRRRAGRGRALAAGQTWGRVAEQYLALWGWPSGQWLVASG